MTPAEEQTFIALWQQGLETAAITAIALWQQVDVSTH
jgi:hypothetical protein